MKRNLQNPPAFHIHWANSVSGMSKANRRYIRTIILAVLAMSSLIWAAIDQFGISPQVMWDLFLATVIGAGGIILAAAIVVALGAGLKKLAGRKQGNRD